MVSLSNNYMVPDTYRNSSFAPKLSHCPQVIISGIGRDTKDSGVCLTQTEVCIDVTDTPRHIVSTHML